MVNPARKRAGMRKTGGLTPAVRHTVCNCGYTRILRRQAAIGQDSPAKILYACSQRAKAEHRDGMHLRE